MPPRSSPSVPDPPRLTTPSGRGLGGVVRSVAVALGFGLGCVAVGAGCSAGGGRRAESAGSATEEVSAGAQDFQLDDVNGRRFQLSEHRGRSVVVMDFWATWCDPCKVELPRLAEIYQRFRDRGLVMVGISVDGPESIAQVRGDVRQLRIPFPVLLDQESRVVALYNPRRSAPYTVVIDRAGRIVHRHEGYTPGDEVGLAREIELALGE